jgi:hypothetical protein
MIGKIVREVVNDLSVSNFYSIGDEPEFNNLVDDNAIFPVVLFVNELTTTEELKRTRTFKEPVYPVQILFLDRVLHKDTGEDISFDANGDELEEVYTNMRALAREFILAITKRDEWKKTDAETQSFTLSNVNHLFDSDLSGVILNADIPLFIEYDYCKVEC